MKLRSINQADHLYVIGEGAGSSCYGFDVLDRKARAVGAWLSERTNNPHAVDAARAWLPLLDASTIGTVDHFELCSNILERAQIYCGVFGDRCGVDTSPALRGLEGKRVEATVNGQRRRFLVGLSTGWLPCHVARHNARARSGEGLSLSDEITDVKVIR